MYNDGPSALDHVLSDYPTESLSPLADRRWMQLQMLIHGNQIHLEPR